MVTPLEDGNNGGRDGVRLLGRATLDKGGIDGLVIICDNSLLLDSVSLVGFLSSSESESSYSNVDNNIMYTGSKTTQSISNLHCYTNLHCFLERAYQLVQECR